MSLLDHKSKYVFLHNPKVAGTSIEILIGGSSHETMWGYVQRNPTINFDEYFKFMVGRNPYDRLISVFHFLPRIPWPNKIQKGHPGWQGQKRLFYSRVDLEGCIANFDTFIDSLDYFFDFNLVNYSPTVTKLMSPFDHLAPQHYWCCIDGINVLDSILRFDDLDNEWARIREKIDRHDTKLQHTNANRVDGGQMRVDQISMETINKINEKYELSFKTLGYKMLCRK